MDLTNKVALVTGAAKRVGRAIALRLAGCGCHVAIHYGSSRVQAEKTAQDCRRAFGADHRRPAEGGQAAPAAGGAGTAAEVFQADLADADATARLVPAVVARLGRLDVLVNNASVFEPMTIDQFDLAAWDRTLRVNLTAPMILAAAARAAFAAAGGGRIINLCDAATHHPWAGHLAYMASKGALDTLTRALAAAIAPDANVVGIALGVAAWPDSYDRATRDRLTARIPLRRAGTPEDIAAAVEFVLREGDYMTGTILTIDGGRSLR